VSKSIVETPRSLPKLAYVYHPRSFATLSLAEAAQGVCEMLWIIDTSQEEVASMARLLRKFGPALDVAGLTFDDAAALVALHAPRGILALADDCLRWTAEIATRLNLPFLTPETAFRLTDKHAQREALSTHGLVVPRSWVITQNDSDETWSRVKDEATFPAVLKPRQGEASRDTLPVHSFDEFRALWESNRTPAGHIREFVLEEFIPDSLDAVAGEGFAGYVSVESFVCDGRITHLAINGRMPPAYPFRETGFFIPAELDSDQQRDVLTVASAGVMAMGITVGCLHTEIKLTPSGPVVIEVNGRIGGGVPEMLVAATGVRLLSLAMRLAIGESVVSDEMPACHRVAYLFYVHADREMQKVTSVSGLDELREVPGIDEIILNRGPGQPVDWREGNHGHVFSVFGTAADHDELRHVMYLVASLTKIEGQ
jgi:biotin carboxylase